MKKEMTVEEFDNAVCEYAKKFMKISMLKYFDWQYTERDDAILRFEFYIKEINEKNIDLLTLLIHTNPECSVKGGCHDSSDIMMVYVYIEVPYDKVFK